MESGNCSAGDGYEQGREHKSKRTSGRSQRIFESGECRDIQGCMAHQSTSDDTGSGYDHHEVQKEGA